MHPVRIATRIPVAALAAALLAACSDDVTAPGAPPADATGARAAASIQCEPDNAGLTLPAGFCAVIVADNLGAARHMAVRKNGDLYVALNNRPGAPGGVVALRDTDDDGKADVVARFGDDGGNGIAYTAEYLWFAPNDRVLRWHLDPNALVPTGAPTTIVSGLPDVGDHVSKSLALGRGASLFVNIGSATNSCQVLNRVTHSPGIDPCPELPVRAGIWRFDRDRAGQTEASGDHFATGVRNAVALAVNPVDMRLYAVQHGRDELHDDWPEFFTIQQGADLPSEEFIRVTEGIDNGWPYCFHDWQQNLKVLAPEYGGDGHVVGRCAGKNQPLMTFPGHLAPNGLLFYTGTQFPARYRDGAFVALHGSHDRTPLPQEGYEVAFVPMNGTTPSPSWEVFASGFPGVPDPTPQTALHRPVGLAQANDGSLYVSDDKGGRIYRIVWKGR